MVETGNLIARSINTFLNHRQNNNDVIACTHRVKQKRVTQCMAMSENKNKLEMSAGERDERIIRPAVISLYANPGLRATNELIAGIKDASFDRMFS